jgi:hypothetical protein
MEDPLEQPLQIARLLRLGGWRSILHDRAEDNDATPATTTLSVRHGQEAIETGPIGQEQLVDERFESPPGDVGCETKQRLGNRGRLEAIHPDDFELIEMLGPNDACNRRAGVRASWHDDCGLALAKAREPVQVGGR